MGTPDLNLRGAMKLFKEIGYDGIEVRCAKDGQIDTTIADDEFIALAKSWCSEYGISIVCLTPYFKDFVSDQRELELARMRRAIQIASILDCPNVRAYGGIDPDQSSYPRQQIWEKTASGLRELGHYAQRLGVRLCVETHAYTLTLTAKETRAMVDEVGLPNVGVLFDPAWIAWAREESVADAAATLGDRIFHCHYKDFKFLSREAKPEKESCLMGEGDVPWTEIVAELRKTGYDGVMSDEYEKYWNPDVLPEPGVGMKKNMEYVRRLSQ
jgi:sugar phosphate isomerase/epimerase